MNDRELLELAAKAVGIVGVWDERGQCILVTNCAGMPDWRPQNDDGDSMRLSVSLLLEIHYLDGFKQVCARRRQDMDNFEMHGLVGYGEGADPWVSPESVRRAIVRAAAAIGEAMQ